MKRLLSALFCGALATMMTSTLVHAHGGHDGRLKISASETEIRLETSLSVSTFMHFDMDGDGYLAVSEYEVQFDDIARWIDEQLILSDNHSEVVKAYFSDSPIVDRRDLDPSDAIKNVKILRRYKLSDDALNYQLNIDLFDHSPNLLYSRSGQLGGLYSLLICSTSSTEKTSIACNTL